MYKENVPKEIIDFLKNNFLDLDSIILHGSRAAGFAREHSDWDFILLSEKKQKQEHFRHNIGKYNFEYELYLLPIEEKDIFTIFSAKLQFSKIIFDRENKGKDLLKKVKSFYEKGIPKKFFSDAFRQTRKVNRLYILRELEELVDEPAFFVKKMGKIYPQIINEWYWFKKKDYPKNIYISIPQIRKEDPWFFNELKILYLSEYTNLDKVNALKKIIKYIYEK